MKSGIRIAQNIDLRTKVFHYQDHEVYLKHAKSQSSNCSSVLAVTEITNQVISSDFDPREICSILNQFYGAASEHSSNEVTYSRAGSSSHALRVEFQGEKIRLYRGPDFQEEDLRELAQEIKSLNASSTLIGRSVLFSSYPVIGIHNANNLLQILPVPAHAPKSPTPFASGAVEHPFLLEFQFADSPNELIRQDRSRQQAHEITLLLNALLEGYITYDARRGGWAETTSPGAPTSQYVLCRSGYGYEGFATHATEFSPVDSLRPIKQTIDASYYTSPLKPGHTLEVHRSFTNLVNKFYSLGKDDRDMFLRAAFWLHQAAQPGPRSVSFLSLIYAIDTLVPPEKGHSPCSLCQKLSGPTVTDRFVAFLNKMVPDSSPDTRENSAARRKLFKLRSDLAHGRDILSLDRMDQGFTSISISQSHIYWHALLLAKMTIVNWLTAR